MTGKRTVDKIYLFILLFSLLSLCLPAAPLLTEDLDEKAKEKRKVPEGLEQSEFKLIWTYDAGG